MTALAIIPARAGSKGLPDKNIRELAGKPLVAWSIEAALDSGVFSRVLVSTDSERYADIAREHGATVPFLRPSELATDTAIALDCYRHVLSTLAESGERFDTVWVLQPTSPLRTAGDVRGAHRQLMENETRGAVVSVTELEHPIEWVNTLPDDLCMKDFLRPTTDRRNRQEHPTYYRLNGALYGARIGYFDEVGGFYGPRTYAYVMHRQASVDIDDLFDFRLAEYLMTERSQ